MVGTKVAPPTGSGVQRVDSSVRTGRAAAGEPSAAASSSAGGKTGNMMTYKGQDFYKLRADLAAAGKLFEDPEFPATQSSLFFSQPTRAGVEWKRPGELLSNPRFVVGEANRFDVSQGELGDCWLLASVASLSMVKELFDRVIPRDQEYGKENQYAGIFHFRFWQYGNWTDIVVDDRLPTINNQLLYMHSREQNEFWSALLEKAYAKLFGSYEALKSGSSSEAMVDFTGGLTEVIELGAKQPQDLFSIMLKAVERCALMGCSIEADPNRVEAVLPNGLIMGHAYSVTDVRFVDINAGGTKGKIPLVRVRNPWGNEAEWKGAWSDKSREWQTVSEDERKKLGLSFDADGEFWMSFKDFSSNFQRLEICHLGPDSLEADQISGKTKRRYEQIVINGSWVRRVSAGGCRNFIDTFWTNPQYRVIVVDGDEGDNENLGTLIVGLMQKDRRKKKKEGADVLTIGYIIYKAEKAPDGPLDVTFFKQSASVARCPNFTNLREVSGRHRLAPGKYLVVPSTFNPGEEADFLVRLYSEKQNQAEESDSKTEIKSEPPAPAGTVTVKAEVEEKLKKVFAAVAGEDLEIDAYELRDVLNATFKKDFPFDGFSLETCRSIVALFDVDQTGKLGLDEFARLWGDLRKYQQAFAKFDADKSGKMSSHELREAYKELGISLSNKSFQSLVMRFANKKGEIEFDDFVLCTIRLKTVFDTFKSHKKDKDGNGLFTIDEFVHEMMYS